MSRDRGKFLKLKIAPIYFPFSKEGETLPKTGMKLHSYTRLRHNTVHESAKMVIRFFSSENLCIVQTNNKKSHTEKKNFNM